MWDDAVILVASDNGAPVSDITSTDDDGTVTRPTLQRAGGSNYPLRGGKASQFEGGIRSNAFVTGGFIPEAMRGKTLQVGRVDPICVRQCGGWRVKCLSGPVLPQSPAAIPLTDPSSDPSRAGPGRHRRHLHHVLRSRRRPPR